MCLLTVCFIFSNMYNQQHKSILLTIVVLILNIISPLHAQIDPTIDTIRISTQSHNTTSYPDSNNLCSFACVQLSLKELLDRNDTNSVCCWLASVDESHKIYIDVNVTKLLGKGSWAIVYDTYLHDDVK